MIELTDNSAKHRYEMVVEDLMAYVTYARKDDRLVLVHTQVPDALGGKGVGSALARSVLEDADRRGLQVAPECEFIAGFIKRHPEFQGLVADSNQENPDQSLKS